MDGCECADCCERRRATRLEALGLEEYRKGQARADEIDDEDEEEEDD
ncbi:MAG: hypothetical protein AB1468_06375 [Candidatus Micrarchaeota archaeon]